MQIISCIPGSGPPNVAASGFFSPDPRRWGRVLVALVAVVCLIGETRAAHGQNRILFSADPDPLIVQTATAGFPPDPAIDASTTYTLDASANDAKITASVDAALPPGVTLQVHLEPPPGATDMGDVTLTTTEQSVVENIPKGTYFALQVTYTLSATLQAGPVAPGTRTVTFTVSSGRRPGVVSQSRVTLGLGKPVVRGPDRVISEDRP